MQTQLYPRQWTPGVNLIKTLGHTLPIGMLQGLFW